MTQDSRSVAAMPSVARRLALALAPALIDAISLALFRMHLPTKIAKEAEL
jgi:capsular polysaccharide biosynthesis protein